MGGPLLPIAAMSALDETQRAAEAQFSRQSQRYAKGHILENVEDVREAATHLDLPARARVLDVACGAGHTGLYFASPRPRRHLRRPHRRHARPHARSGRRARTHHCHRAASRRGDAARGCIVRSRDVPRRTHHFTSPAAFVREVARVLRPGGAFLLIDGTVPDDDPAPATG
jgi:SAM-dependent methyltransferase